MTEYLLLAVLGGIVSMDTTEGPQWLVSEPIVSCTMAGFLFGDIQTGVLLGVLFQMLWIGYLPLGAVHFTDNNMGALIASASALAAQNLFGLTREMMGAAVIVALMYGTWVSIVGLHARNIVRQFNAKRNERFLARIERDEAPSITACHMAGVGSAFLRGAAMTLILAPVGVLICSGVRHLPEGMITSSWRGAKFLAGAAAASAILFYRVRNRNQLLSLGALGGIIWALIAIG